MLRDAGAGTAAGLQSVSLPLPSYLTGSPKGLCRILRADNYHLRGLLNQTTAYLKSQGSAGLVRPLLNGRDLVLLGEFWCFLHPSKASMGEDTVMSGGSYSQASIPLFSQKRNPFLL